MTAARLLICILAIAAAGCGNEPPAPRIAVPVAPYRAPFHIEPEMPDFSVKAELEGQFHDFKIEDRSQ